MKSGLNAPFGARYFLTHRVNTVTLGHKKSKCTFWRSVLSDLGRRLSEPILGFFVLMHLLALGAF